jgi:hypothetical protein
MTKATIFSRLSRAGRYISLLGVIAIFLGMAVGSKPIVGAGCLLLALSAYVLAFAITKSF